MEGHTATTRLSLSILVFNPEELQVRSKDDCQQHKLLAQSEVCRSSPRWLELSRNVPLALVDRLTLDSGIVPNSSCERVS